MTAESAGIGADPDRISAEDILSRLETVPTLSSVVNRILYLSEKPDTDAADLTRVIRLDPALTSQILKIVNSAYYGFPRKISTVNQAVVLLGFNSVKNLALSASIIHILDTNAGDGFDLRAFWRGSIAVGMLALSLGRRTRYPIPEECLVAGILHRFGMLILLQHFRTSFMASLADAGARRTSILDAERRIFGVTHCRIGALVADRWRFPSYLTECILKYPAPGNASLNPPLAALTHLGAYMAHDAGYAYPSDPIPAAYSPVVADILEVGPAGLERLIADARGEIGAIDEMAEAMVAGK